jgi:hypothetical protein
MRKGRRALAASFVVTFAAGCDGKSTQPPAAPTVDVGNAPVPAPASASAAAAPSGSVSAPADSVAASALPAAPSTGHVKREDDGTCTWFPDRSGVRSPSGRVFFNPPPPRKVQCPPGDGGS